MSDVQPPFDELTEKELLNEFSNELSEEDLAILQAFEAMESWPPASTPNQNPLVHALSTPELTSADSSSDGDEMWQIFIEEAQEDIGLMRQALRQIEKEGTANPSRFTSVQRAGHKLRGTAGAVDFPLVATIAGQVEDIAEHVTERQISPRSALQALSSAVTALEDCMSVILTTHKEPQSDLLLAALDATYRDLGVDPRQPIQPVLPVQNEVLESLDPLEAEKSPEPPKYPTNNGLPIVEESPTASAVLPVSLTRRQSTQESVAAGAPNVRVELRRLEAIMRHSEYLVERRTVLENAQRQVDIALEEFQSAQTRLQHVESLLPVLQAESSKPTRPTVGTQTPSSLIARILGSVTRRRTTPRNHRTTRILQDHNDTNELNGHSDQEGQIQGPASVWDELDMERYSERDRLINMLKDAMIDVNMTASHVHTAYSRFTSLQREYLVHISSLRRDTLLMRQTPLSTLLPRLQRVVTISALGKPVDFSSSGETLEIEQELLDQLTPSLIQLLRTCIADAFVPDQEQESAPARPRIWLHARESGCEMALEIGFSMTIQGGAVESLRETLQRLNGRLALRRNSEGGVSFILHIPRSQGTTNCLLVYAGNQRLVIPFNQVLRVVEQRIAGPDLTEKYHLNELLGFPVENALYSEHSAPTVLVVPVDQPGREVGILVDQVLEEVDMLVKPLKPYMQRPGIPGAAIDGQGRVMLMVDLPILIERFIRDSTAQHKRIHTQEPVTQPLTHDAEKVRILVADDAAYLRRSVRQILLRDRFSVFEAKDGMEAIERLQEHLPEICLLDIEMPNLNGYDVLHIIRNTPAYAHIKVIMLTSRSSEKHRQHALELGVHAYLIKPCPQETLLATIRDVLQTV